MSNIKHICCNKRYFITTKPTYTYDIKNENNNFTIIKRNIIHNSHFILKNLGQKIHKDNITYIRVCQLNQPFLPFFIIFNGQNHTIKYLGEI